MAVTQQELVTWHDNFQIGFVENKLSFQNSYLSFIKVKLAVTVAV